MFFTRLTSWESACKIIVQCRNISPLYYPLPPSLAHSLLLFLPSLRNKFKTKFQLKTSLEVVLSELKIWDFHYYVQERVPFLQKHSHSLKLQYLFRAHVIFQFTHLQRRAVIFVLGNVVKTWMVSAILGRCEDTPSWTKCREKNYSFSYFPTYSDMSIVKIMNIG